MEKATLNSVMTVVDQMADIIIKNEVPFCELDSVAGDGDFGMSVAKGFKILKENWEELSKDSISQFLKDSSMIITEHCGGASGPYGDQLFEVRQNMQKEKMI